MGRCIGPASRWSIVARAAQESTVLSSHSTVVHENGRASVSIVRQ